MPLLMRLSEEGDIKNVRLVRIDDAHLRPRDRRRNEMLLDGVRMDAIVDFRKFSLRRPAKHLLLFGFQPLKLFYKVQLKLD